MVQTGSAGNCATCPKAKRYPQHQAPLHGGERRSLKWFFSTSGATSPTRRGGPRRILTDVFPSVPPDPGCAGQTHGVVAERRASIPLSLPGGTADAFSLPCERVVAYAEIGPKRRYGRSVL